jgi:hypothetical protein
MLHFVTVLSWHHTAIHRCNYRTPYAVIPVMAVKYGWAYIKPALPVFEYSISFCSNTVSSGLFIEPNFPEG